MSLRHDLRVSHLPTTKSGRLICPHCQTSFPLTWHQYGEIIDVLNADRSPILKIILLDCGQSE